MKQTQFIEMFQKFAAGFPGFTPKDMRETTGAYYRVLKNFDPMTLQLAFDAVSASSKELFPKVAEVYKACEQQRATPLDGEPILLRPLRWCYKGDVLIDGKITWEPIGKYPDGRTIWAKRITRCGCRDCDPIGFADWEMRYAKAKI